MADFPLRPHITYAIDTSLGRLTVKYVPERLELQINNQAYATDMFFAEPPPATEDVPDFQIDLGQDAEIEER